MRPLAVLAAAWWLWVFLGDVGLAAPTTDVPEPPAAIEFRIYACGGEEGRCRWFSYEVPDVTMLQCIANSESAALWWQRQQPLGVWIKRYGCRPIGEGM